MSSVEVETEKLKEAFARFQETSKRSVATNLRQQGKLIAVDIAKRTPPGDFQASGWKRTAGENTVKADIAKIMRPWNNPRARTDPQRIHKEYRRKRGRVVTRLNKGQKDERWRIDAQTYRIYLDQVKKRVGYMAAGWAKAAAFLGASIPNWITRHSAPGSGAVNIRGENIELDLTNNAVYADSRGLVDRRAVAALKKRYWAMIKQADNYLKMAAKEAGLDAT